MVFNARAMFSIVDSVGLKEMERKEHFVVEVKIANADVSSLAWYGHAGTGCAVAQKVVPRRVRSSRRCMDR